MQILKELETVRAFLLNLKQVKYGYCPNRTMLTDIEKALATLDSILKRAPAELVDHVTKALFSETFGFDSFTQEKMRSILDKQVQAALRALGLIPESEE